MRRDRLPAPEFIVTFDGNGGTPSVDSMTTTNQKLTSLPSASRSKSQLRRLVHRKRAAVRRLRRIPYSMQVPPSTPTGRHRRWQQQLQLLHHQGDCRDVAAPSRSSGNVSVREGRDKTFTITPDKGYTVSNVKIDGRSIGAVKSYTFENVKRAHTIEVSFTRANEFIDVPCGDRAFPQAATTTTRFFWEVEAGITKGTSDKIQPPHSSAPRAQIAVFLWRSEGSASGRRPQSVRRRCSQCLLRGRGFVGCRGGYHNGQHPRTTFSPRHLHQSAD